MKAPLSVILTLSLSALAPTFAVPAKFGSKEDSTFRVVHLQEPDAATAAEMLRSVAAQPKLSAFPAQVVYSSRKADSRILHGCQLAIDCQFPHQVALISNGGVFCGGSLIDGSWILTAAHCIPDGVTSILVLAGSVAWQSAPIQVYARSVTLHGGYNNWLNNDIAVVALGVNMDNGGCVKSVELETEGCGTDALDGERVIVSGWGSTRNQSNNFENTLRYEETEIISNNQCYGYYGPTVTDTIFCAVSPIEFDGTQCEDPGGNPTLLKKTGRQVGIKSFVSSYGSEASWPVGYTRVPCFVDWIKAVQAL